MFYDHVITCLTLKLKQLRQILSLCNPSQLKCQRSVFCRREKKKEFLRRSLAQLGLEELTKDSRVAWNILRPKAKPKLKIVTTRRFLSMHQKCWARKCADASFMASGYLLKFNFEFRESD